MNDYVEQHHDAIRRHYESMYRHAMSKANHDAFVGQIAIALDTFTRELGVLFLTMTFNGLGGGK